MTHELLHYVLSREFENAGLIKKNRETEGLYTHLVPVRLKKYYPKWEWAIEEYIIHTIESEITGSSVALKKVGMETY